MNKKRQLIKNKLLSSFRKNMVLGLIVLGLLISNIFLVLQNINTGSRLSSLEKTESELLRENGEISSLLAGATSLTKTHEKSSELGFVKLNDPVYINAGEAVASRL